MPIRPIDVVKTQEVSQIKHMENQKVLHAQEHLSKNFQTMIRQDQQKPTETTKADNYDYQYDAKEKGNNQYNRSGGKKKEKDKEEKKESKDPTKGGRLDLLI